MSSPLSNNTITRADPAIIVRQLMLKYGLTQALQANITELAINRPGSHWVENANGWHQVDNPALTLGSLDGLSAAMAVFNHKVLSPTSPIASLTLPDGERCQIVLPPACQDGTISLTIRKPSSSRFTLADYAASGRLAPALSRAKEAIAPWEQRMIELQECSDFEHFFELAVEHRLNIVTVGSTGSGKSTFTKALVDLYPPSRRIFTIEDAHELTTPKHPNAVHLFFSEGVPAKAVLASCMRMKPEHIFLTELRGDEAWDYLMALRSGHPGSITSVHANNCQDAFHKITDYVKQSPVGQTLDYRHILEKVKTTIDIVVFFEKTYLKEIHFDPIAKLRMLRGEA